MKRYATEISILVVFLLLLAAGSASAQSFENQDLGDWYFIDDDNYTSSGEISDARASDGTYSVRLGMGSDVTQSALVNDNQSVSTGDTLRFRVWISQEQLDTVNGFQPFAQNGNWSYDDRWYGASSLTAGEWNVLEVGIPDGYESTNRIGLQVNSNSESDTTVVYVDEITLNGTILPVELTAFDAVRDGNDVTLKWHTASETNNAGFEVEMQPEGRTWREAGFVEGRGTTTEPQSYTFSLTNLSAGHYSFRLRQMDLDGSASYSPEVRVEITPDGAFELSGPSPNPFTERTRFTLTASDRQAVRVSVYNTLGQRVALLHDGPVAAGATHSFTLKSSGLSSGVYFVRGQSASHTITRQIVLSR